MTNFPPEPTPAEELGARLRQLRKEAGVSGVELARRSGYSQPTISRMERGVLAVSMMAAGRIAWHLRLPRPVTRELIDTARSVAEERASLVPVRTILQVGVDSVQRRIRLRERNVHQLDVFHNSLVPGLLQTEGYIRAIVLGDPPDEVEQFVEERLRRQREAATRSCTIILTEGALYQGMPDPQVMAQQADHIAELAVSHQYWRVGIIPRITGRPNVTHNGFDVYDDEQVFIGTTAGNALMKDPRPVADHVDRFADLADLALFGDEARDVLARIAGEYRRLPGPP